MFVSQNFKTIFPLHFGGLNISIYAGIAALIINLILVTLLTLVCRIVRVPAGNDPTSPADYEEMLETPPTPL